LLGGGFGILKPETSKNFTIGAVWTPEFADLSLAIDYFDIEILDQISTLSATAIITGCYNSSDFENEPLCDLITRGFEQTPPDPTVPNRITEVQATFINVNSQTNKGIDFTGRYRTDTRWGPIELNTQWSHQLEDEIQLLAQSQTTYLNGGLGEPDWTGFGNIMIDPTDKLTLRYRFDYIGHQNTLQSLAAFANTAPEDLPDGAGNYQVEQSLNNTVNLKTDLESMFYHGISAEYEMSNGLTVRGGINNLFDENPPFASTASQAGNSPVVSQYDLRGRRFFLNFSKKFD